MNLDENVLMDMAHDRGLDFKAPKLDGMLEDNDHIHIGDSSFDILHTPGHTPGCISVKMTERDGKRSIFPGDIASTTGRLGFINGPGFDLHAWKSSIKRLISEAPDRIYPGHNTFMLSGDRGPQAHGREDERPLDEHSYERRLGQIGETTRQIVLDSPHAI